MIANISATAPVDTYENVTVGEFLSYSPRCVKRDISNALGQTWANDSMIADLLTNPLYNDNISDWQTQLQTTGTDTVGFYGLHAYGHMTINGDPSTDVRDIRKKNQSTANVSSKFSSLLTRMPSNSSITLPMSPRSGSITPRSTANSRYGKIRTSSREVFRFRGLAR